jgi:hypothetical protein
MKLPLTRENRVHAILAVLFAAVGIFVSIDLITLTHRDMDQDDLLQNQINCNSKLIEVLRTRSEARLQVDTATIDAQNALVAVLQDVQESGNLLKIEDPHILEAIRTYQKSAAARANPALSTPYVDCPAPPT